MRVLNNLTVLYKYDDIMVFNIVISHLDKLFKNVYKVDNAEDALKIFKAKRPDIVLCDVGFFNFDDINMFEAIDKLNHSQRIIMLSANDDINFLKKAIDINIDKYISNPLENVKEIIDALKAVSKSINKDIKLMHENKLLKKQLYELNRQKELIDKNVLLSYSDLDGNITYATKAYLDLLGYKKNELIGKNHSVLKHVGHDKSLIKNLWKSISKDIPWRGEFQNIKKDGTLFWVKVVIEPLYDENGKKVGYSAVKEDITDRKKVEMLSITDMLTGLYNRRHFSEVLLKELSSAKRKKVNLCLIMADVDYFKQYNDFYGHQAGDDILQKVAKQLILSTGRGNDFAFRIGGEEFAIITSNMSDEDVVVYAQNIRKSIENLKIEHEKSKISDYITASFGIMNFYPATEMLSADDIYNIVDQNLYDAKKEGRNRVVFYKAKIDRNEYCNIDKITKLPDRIELYKAIKRAKNDVMLMLISLNDFSHLKEQYDNELIDDILIEKSKDLRRVILDKDTFLFRLNVNEFAILVTKDSQFEKYISIMEYAILQNTVCNMYYKDVEYKIVINYTIGVAYGREKVLNMANSALQKAATTTKGFYIYMNESNIKEIRQTNLEKLKVYKEALENDNIFPYFQPIVDIKTGETVKYEALARLKDSNGNIVSPFMFLNAVKEDKTWEYFTRQMLRKIFDIYSKNSVDIAINLTYENISSPTLVEYIKNRLDLFGGERITFEIVESEDIENYELLGEFILFVKSYGCKIAIDDFGSGYSNFTNIVKLNTDFLKLDGTIIESLSIDKNVEIMAKSLIRFAKETSIQTIAEFVSSQDIAQHVKELGIDFVQGYEYGKPESPEFYGLNV